MADGQSDIMMTDNLVLLLKSHQTTEQKKAGKKGATWDGVRNYQAANNLNKMNVGLEVISGFEVDILDELGISEDMRIQKPGKISDYDERDILVAKALKVVKERRKEETAAFRKMAQEMKDNNKKVDIKKVN